MHVVGGVSNGAAGCWDLDGIGGAIIVSIARDGKLAASNSKGARVSIVGVGLCLGERSLSQLLLVKSCGRHIDDDVKGICISS